MACKRSGVRIPIAPLGIPGQSMVRGPSGWVSRSVDRHLTVAADMPCWHSASRADSEWHTRRGRAPCSLNGLTGEMFCIPPPARCRALLAPIGDAKQIGAREGLRTYVQIVLFCGCSVVGPRCLPLAVGAVNLGPDAVAPRATSTCRRCFVVPAPCRRPVRLQQDGLRTGRRVVRRPLPRRSGRCLSISRVPRPTSRRSRVASSRGRLDSYSIGFLLLCLATALDGFGRTCDGGPAQLRGDGGVGSLLSATRRCARLDRHSASGAVG